MIYCRVSSAKQLAQGDGLAGQELSCRRYADTCGYRVLGVFTDGITGSSDDRRGLTKMLEFLEGQPRGMVVLVDDLKRFARDVLVHFGLKDAILERGARMESPSFRFEDTPEGRFIETVIAAQGELERGQNQRQVMNRMRSRLEAGYWVFRTPPGYRYERRSGHKKLLVPDERQELVREVLEGYATGSRFPRMADMERFLRASGFWASHKPGNAPHRIFQRTEQVGRMLELVYLYAGCVEFAPWKVGLRSGNHEAIISLETAERVRERWERRHPVPSKPGSVQTVHSEDGKSAHVFALRGVVRCASCGWLLTASLSRSETGKRYAYYHCPRRGCEQFGKTTPCARLEDQFARLLEPLVLPDAVFEMAVASLRAQHARECAEVEATRKRDEKQLRELEDRLNKLLETASLTRSAVLLRALEAKVEPLIQERDHLVTKLARDRVEGQKGGLEAGPHEDVGTLVEGLRQLLQNPLQTYLSGDAKTRQLVARVAFPGSVVFARGNGLGTAEYGLPYRVLATLADNNTGMVDLSRTICKELSTELRALEGAIRDLVLPETERFERRPPRPSPSIRTDRSGHSPA